MEEQIARREAGVLLAAVTTRAPAGGVELPGHVERHERDEEDRGGDDRGSLFFEANKPVAALCHAAWLVLEAGEARGRRIAAWPSLKTDLRNAGAEWLDAPVVVDGNLVSGRKPDDIPVFNHAMLRLFEEAARKLRAGHHHPARP